VHVETTGIPGAAADRDLIERHVDRVILRPQAVEVRLMSSHTAEPTETGRDEPDPGELTNNLTLPSVKGIVHEPTAKPP
jgi:hypothetical protein